MNFKINNTWAATGAGGPSEREAEAFGWALGLVVCAALAARLLAVPPLLPDLDAVNFARALERFDLAAQAPHFPGYPVYVALARLAAATGVGEVWALALPGVVLGALAVGALGLALRPHLGPAGALAGAALLALWPLPVLFGGAPGSDGAGLALLVLAASAVLALVARQEAPRLAALWVGLLASLALGARPSYLAALAGLALVLPRRWRAQVLAGSVLGAAAWLVPLVVVSGPAALLRIGTGFLHGHTSEWGGTLAVRPELGWRLEQLGFDVLAAGLGMPWSGPAEAPALAGVRWGLALLVAGALVALGHAALGRALTQGERRVAALALALGLPYGAWMFVGQNLLKSRHALPVVLALALLVATGLAAWARQRGRLAVPAVGALALSAAAVAWPVARAQGNEPSPAARLVAHVASTLTPAGTLLFTGEEARLFEHSVPPYRAGRPATAEQLRREVALVAAAGAHVYVTSAAPGAALLAPHLVPVQRFTCDRRVRSHAHELVLFRYQPSPGVSRPQGVL